MGESPDLYLPYLSSDHITLEIITLYDNSGSDTLSGKSLEEEISSSDR